MGHEDQFPAAELSARSRFGQGTFAGTRGKQAESAEGRHSRLIAQNLLPIAVPSQPGGVSGRIASAGHADHVAKPPELAKPVATVPRYPAAYRQTIEGGRVA